MDKHQERTILIQRLTKAADALRSAEEAHTQACRVEADARSKECAARNEVNKAQKELDAVLKQLHEGAAWNTDWHQQRNRGEPVPS